MKHPLKKKKNKKLNSTGPKFSRKMPISKKKKNIDHRELKKWSISTASTKPMAAPWRESFRTLDNWEGRIPQVPQKKMCEIQIPQNFSQDSNLFQKNCLRSCPLRFGRTFRRCQVGVIIAETKKVISNLLAKCRQHRTMHKSNSSIAHKQPSFSAKHSDWSRTLLPGEQVGPELKTQLAAHFFLPPLSSPSPLRSQLTTLPSITTPLPSMKATRERPSQFLKVSHTNGCWGWKLH